MRRDELVLVHADGGECHGMALDPDGRCPGCGIHPDMQSTELWPPGEIRGKHDLKTNVAALLAILVVCLVLMGIVCLEHV